MRMAMTFARIARSMTSSSSSHRRTGCTSSVSSTSWSSASLAAWSSGGAGRGRRGILHRGAGAGNVARAGAAGRSGGRVLVDTDGRGESSPSSSSVVGVDVEGGKTASAAAVEMIDTKPPRGTRDFLPADMRLRQWLFSHFRSVSHSMGFDEVDYPVLESEALFTRKAGEEISEQLYSFEDKGGRRVALRPELTPSLARLVLGKGRSAPLPIKWFAIGQCWRYERTTRGRRREHYQWNMDVIGVGGSEAEAELLAGIVSFFRRVGLTEKDVGLRVSSRRVLQRILEKHGVGEELFGPVCIIVDKVDKLPREKIEQMMGDLGVPAAATEGILRALTLKSVDDLREVLGGSSGDSNGADDACITELENVFKLAEGYGIRDWIELDVGVVRGLAYYTGIVFEGFDRTGELRAICGGGRYDKLLGMFGGDDLPCCGFGFGDAVIVELLQEKGLIPDLGGGVDDVVVCLGYELRADAAGVAQRLRDAGRVVDLVLEQKKMKWVFKHAERLGAGRLVIVAGDELERGSVRVKDLASREELDVRIDDL